MSVANFFASWRLTRWCALRSSGQSARSVRWPRADRLPGVAASAAGVDGGGASSGNHSAVRASEAPDPVALLAAEVTDCVRSSSDAGIHDANGMVNVTWTLALEVFRV